MVRRRDPRRVVKGRAGSQRMIGSWRWKARETSRGLSDGIELLAAAGPALLLFKELLSVGRCVGHRGNAGKDG